MKSAETDMLLPLQHPLLHGGQGTLQGTQFPGSGWRGLGDGATIADRRSEAGQVKHRSTQGPGDHQHHQAGEDDRYQQDKGQIGGTVIVVGQGLFPVNE